MFCPRSEISELTIISVIGKPHLWAYEQDLPVVCNDTTVINHVLVYNWPFVGVFSKPPENGTTSSSHADITNDVHGRFGGQDFGQYLPRMENSITYSRFYTEENK